MASNLHHFLPMAEAGIGVEISEFWVPDMCHVSHVKVRVQWLTTNNENIVNSNIMY